MRACLPDYELRVPKTLAEALAWLSQAPGDLSPFAGGTDLMVVLETGRLKQSRFVSLWGLNELRGIRVEKDLVEIGALTTYSEIRADACLSAEFPLLGRAAGETGAVAIQNRGTIGGNIANASPAADSPPALLVYDAELELISSGGTRVVAYRDFHLSYKKTQLAPGELIKSVRLPRRTAGLEQYYRKAGTRRAQAISKICLAAAARVQGSAGHLTDVRIAFGAVAPVPLRCRRVEAALNGRAIDAASRAATVADARAALALEIAPIDDIRSTAAFRRAVAGNLLEEFLCGIGSKSSPS